MNELSWSYVCWFLLVAAGELWVMTRLIRMYRPTHVPAAKSSSYPRAMVVLCLRDSDVFLRSCLTRLTTLDYPNYFLRIVIDSTTDPVNTEVDDFLSTKPPVPVDVRYLGRRRPHCSGKICGILRATEDLSPDIQVVAFFDGDSLAHPSCLRELIAPLADHQVGVTSGNRWYAPRTSGLISLIRAYWNGFAIGLMNAGGIPWGGCMALRASVLLDPEYRAALEYGFGEESITATYLKRRGQQARFVADATLINHEETTLPTFYNFLIRQLLSVRVNNPHWPVILLHSLLASGTLTVGLTLSLFPTLKLVPLIAYCVLTTIAIAEPIVAFHLVKRTVAKRNVALQLPTWRQLVWLPVVVLGTMVASLVSTLHVPFVRRHLWRGITYQIGGRRPVEVLHVAPTSGVPRRPSLAPQPAVVPALYVPPRVPSAARTAGMTADASNPTQM